ncbi:ubiquinone menaquinone biosynthesis [Stylonychia lemnae]|uniref:2-methoxy-6-polyprenyl-1,4-benzoquinol methylase, mitochondrial n=1 Tax=Stylonychia lemnae TaxID=5949 RepID=A0A078B2S5_STYLE|nr:ubiquinone menaquinone biosynthesis [Stylonychia lemnae]|eukprot:CDW87522.1 ubiquinone menaquinone biosynthesis [Stylonychia lemnae]
MMNRKLILSACRQLKQRQSIFAFAQQRTFATGTSEQSRQEKIDFGFKDVNYEEKEKMVRQVFSNVADSYDVMNDAMSLGVHRCWKDQFVNQLGPLRTRRVVVETSNQEREEKLKVIDVAGGTGDISFRILNKAKKDSPTQLSVDITVSDINPNMLEVGKKRAVEQGLFHDLSFMELNAENLSNLKSDDFDIYTIAFGIRNVTDRQKALKEAYRVLRKGGRFMCLEFSEVEVPGLKQFYDFYSFNIIPQLGQFIANDIDSYQYLVESIRKFPKQAEFAKLIEDAGFKAVTYTNLTGGIVAIHSGFKV